MAATRILTKRYNTKGGYRPRIAELRGLNEGKELSGP